MGVAKCSEVKVIEVQGHLGTQLPFQGHRGTQLPFLTKKHTILHETGIVTICYVHSINKFSMLLS